jgi:hypothetical protein
VASCRIAGHEEQASATDSIPFRKSLPRVEHVDPLFDPGAGHFICHAIALPDRPARSPRCPALRQL